MVVKKRARSIARRTRRPAAKKKRPLVAKTPKKAAKKVVFKKAATAKARPRSARGGASGASGGGLALRAPAARPGVPASAPVRTAPRPTHANPPGSSPTNLARYSREFSLVGGVERHIERSALLTNKVADLSENVCLTITLPTESGEPLQKHKAPLTLDTFQRFRPRREAHEIAIERLKALGYRILRRGRFTVSVSAPARLVRETCKTDLLLQARPQRVSARSTMNFAANFEPPRPQDLFVAPRHSLSLASEVGAAIDHFVFIPPPISFAPAARPPARGFHGVDAADIRRLLNVPASATGAGVKIAVIDTGFHPHPFYSANPFSFTTVPTVSAPNPERDPEGHGTAIATNVFATAPRAEVVGYQRPPNPQDALEQAADDGADIITCSWGWDEEEVFATLQAPLLDIISEGKIVIFASGNGHYAWPASQPEVLSVGGVFWNSARQLEASDYASGFVSSRFPGRRTPDVCGLCGQAPKGIYIMMPTEPGSKLDRGQAGPAFPDGDLTTDSDGWVGASGTSSAAPQIAGVVAGLLQKARSKNRTLSLEDVRAILERSAVAVTTGANAMRTPAIGHPNAAVGWGLVDAGAALALI